MRNRNTLVGYAAFPIPAAFVQLRQTTQVSTNAFAVSRLRSTEPAAGRVQSLNHARVAIGLYCTAAMFNHSCVPNALATFEGGEIRVIATRAIDKGEPITISYGPLVSKASPVRVRDGSCGSQKPRRSRTVSEWRVRPAAVERRRGCSRPPRSLL